MYIIKGGNLFMAYQPKSYRKFLATGVATALVATAVAPAAFAAESVKFNDIPSDVEAWAGDAIDYLVEKGAIQGNSNGDFNPKAELTRGAAAKILAISLGLDVDAENTTELTDLDGHWSKEYVAALQTQKPGVINGYADATFRPEGTITRQEMAKMVVEAYGLELDENADIEFSDNTGWGAEYVNVLASLGVVEGLADGTFAPEAKVNRAQSVVFVHRTEVEDVRKEVPQKVVELKVDTLEVVNGKELVVTFTQALNKDDVAGKVTINGASVGTPSLSEDGKTLTLTAATAINVENGVVVVEPIKSKADEKKLTEKYVSLITYKDTVAASVASVSAEGTTAKVSFSEPVFTQGTVSINGSVYSNVELSADGKTLTIKGLEAEKSYSLALVGVKDFANNLSNPISLSFTVAKVVEDTVKPTVTTNVSGNKLTLNFSKEVTSGTVFFGNTEVTVGIPSVTAGITVSEDKKTVEIDTQELGILGANSFLNTTIKVQDFAAGTNVMEAVTINATLFADTVAPTFTAATAKADGTIVVEFDQDVVVPTATALKVTTIDGITQSPAKTFAVQTVEHLTVDGKTSKNKLVYTVVEVDGFDKFEVEKNYGIELPKEEIVDVYGNANGDVVKFTVERPKVDEVKDPKAVVTSNISEDKNVITVVYSENMTDSAKNPLNYTLGGRVLPADSKVEFINNRQFVKITLPTGFVTATGDYNFAIGNVVAVSGNTLADGNTTSTEELDESVAPTVLSTLTVNSSSEVVVTFSEVIDFADGDFEGVTTKVNGSAVDVASYSIANNSNKLVVELAEAVKNASDQIVVEFKDATIVDLSALKNKVVDGSAKN